MRITSKQLNYLIYEINKKEGRPVAYHSNYDFEYPNPSGHTVEAVDKSEGHLTLLHDGKSRYNLAVIENNKEVVLLRVEPWLTPSLMFIYLLKRLRGN